VSVGSPKATKVKTAKSVKSAKTAKSPKFGSGKSGGKGSKSGKGKIGPPSKGVHWPADKIVGSDTKLTIAALTFAGCAVGVMLGLAIRRVAAYKDSDSDHRGSEYVMPDGPKANENAPLLGDQDVYDEQLRTEYAMPDAFCGTSPAGVVDIITPGGNIDGQGRCLVQRSPPRPMHKSEDDLLHSSDEQ